MLRKRGWLGTKPGECPFDDYQVYVKKEKRGVDPYKTYCYGKQQHELRIILGLFSEDVGSTDWPMKAELHQFMILTAIRKSEALRFKKEVYRF